MLLTSLHQLRAVLAGNFGSIITLGIGPIVSASIILQLLVGGKIINLDLSKPEDKAVFPGNPETPCYHIHII